MSDNEFVENQSDNDQDTDIESLSEGLSDNDVNDDEMNETDEMFQNDTIDAPIILDPSLDDDDVDESDERFDKIANATEVFHSRNNIISRDEMKSYLVVKRDKNNVIVDSNHKTIPILTKYEKTKIIGLRAVQIQNGLKPFIDVPSDVIDASVIADMELHKKKIPFILRRPVSLTNYEYWPLEELEII